jgi:hypothetical protein
MTGEEGDPFSSHFRVTLPPQEVLPFVANHIRYLHLADGRRSLHFMACRLRVDTCFVPATKRSSSYCDVSVLQNRSI